MKIASTDLALHSDHAARMRDHRSESLRAWRGERPDFEGQRSSGMQSGGTQSAITSISECRTAIVCSHVRHPAGADFYVTRDQLKRQLRRHFRRNAGGRGGQRCS